MSKANNRIYVIFEEDTSLDAVLIAFHLTALEVGMFTDIKLNDICNSNGCSKFKIFSTVYSSVRKNIHCHIGSHGSVFDIDGMAITRRIQEVGNRIVLSVEYSSHASDFIRRAAAKINGEVVSGHYLSSTQFCKHDLRNRQPMLATA